MDLPKQKRAAQTKRAAPNGAARKLNYQLFHNEHAATQRRSSGRGNTFASRDPAEP